MAGLLLTFRYRDITIGSTAVGLAVVLEHQVGNRPDAVIPVVITLVEERIQNVKGLAKFINIIGVSLVLWMWRFN